MGISVGSEDLCKLCCVLGLTAWSLTLTDRVSPIGIKNKSGVGAGPAEVTRYINQVRDALKNTPLGTKPVGHVDTWTTWVDPANAAVITASDFIGMDAYPYVSCPQNPGIPLTVAPISSRIPSPMA